MTANMNGVTVQRATRTLGLEVQPDAVAVQAAAPHETFLPFLRTSATDRRYWQDDAPHVRARAQRLNSITARGGHPRFAGIVSADMVVNPVTDIVYKVRTPWIAGAPPIAPFPSAEEEERQLRNLGERFTGLPTIEPAVDFYNALKQLQAAGPVPPTMAKEVIAYLVIHHTRHYGPRPVWVIQTRGIELEPEGYAAMSPVHPDATNHMRHVVDASTGQWLYSDTAPQPV